ncbi:hypothetical protein A2U01_0083963, partial [Trifolium medium]|nr:hypothetical protein [Trifolium medium]
TPAAGPPHRSGSGGGATATAAGHRHPKK